MYSTQTRVVPVVFDWELRAYMCQDENKNEPQDESVRSFWINPVTDEPGPQYYDTLKDQFVRHALAPEQTKALVLVFVIVLGHEQAINTGISYALLQLVSY